MPFPLGSANVSSFHQATLRVGGGPSIDGTELDDPIGSDPPHPPQTPTPDQRSTAMQTILSQVHRFLDNEDGPTAVEYAVMLALILVACITIVTSLGTSTSGTFSTVNAAAS
jgi:pilus assembly protein Flp/PilA